MAGVHTNLMSGLRLTAGGLHLGHYLGCLSPLNNLSDQNLYFVIRDRGEAVSKNKDLYYKNLIKILADLSSTRYSSKIKFLLQSSIYKHLQILVDYVEDFVTLKQLINVHPSRTKIKTNSISLTIKDFLFPIESACTYYALKADRILMNDDNSATVKFASNLCKKINNDLGSNIFIPPILVHGSLPRLLGHNYEKMSKKNNNALYFTDSYFEIDKKLDKLLSFKYFFNKFPEFAKERAILKNRFFIPNNYLPFQYLAIFAKDQSIDNTKINYFANYNNFEEFKSHFKKEMHAFFEEIRERRSYLIESDLIEKLDNDTKEGEAIAKDTVEVFLELLGK